MQKHFAVCIVAFCIAVHANAATLIHHCPFDTNASDVVGGAAGTLMGGATVSGGELFLDGLDDYVQFGQFLVPPSGSYSIALYARETGAPQDPLFTEFISQGTPGGPGFYLGTYKPPSTPRVIRASDAWQLTGVRFPADGELHHYALTVDATARKSRLYVDGILRATLETNIQTIATGSATRLGRQLGSYGEYFRGRIDDVRVYSGVVTAEEVATLTSRLPPVLTIRVSEVEVSWLTVSNFVYQPQYKDTFNSTWTSFGVPVTGDGTTVRITDKVLPDQPPRFYRVEVTPQ
jgi:hypothetical protein